LPASVDLDSLASGAEAMRHLLLAE
jgi:hypothetical protein